MAWDPNLVYQETTAISDEIRGFVDKSLFGHRAEQPRARPPRLRRPDVLRADREHGPRPALGPHDEAFGEDPYLVSQIADAFVNGLPGQHALRHVADRLPQVAATAKHYALNNVEDNRTGISSDVSDTDLRDYYTASVRQPDRERARRRPDDVVQRDHGTPSVADTYTLNQLAQTHVRLQRLTSHPTAARSAPRTTCSPAATTGRRPAGPPTTRAAPATWTNTTTGATIPAQAGGQAYALRAGTEPQLPRWRETR